MIAAIDVSGVTKLSNVEIERLIYPYLGPGRTNEDVIAAQKAIESAYMAKGFDAVLVEVPVQPAETFGQGIVQIAVNEAPVGRVRVTDSKYHSLNTVLAQVPSLTPGEPVNLRDLQRDISAANRFPDRVITPSFRPGQVPGTIDIDLKVQDDLPLHASLTLNNDNSPSTSPLRLTGTVRYTNLWEAGHTLSATYAVAPQHRSESEVISGSYTAPFIGTPLSLLLYGYRSNSNVAALGGTNVLGNGYQIGFRAIYRLPSESTFQTISIGPDFKSFDEQIFVAGQPIRPAPIRYLPLVADYTIAGSGESDSYSLSLGATAGLRVIKRLSCVDPDTAQVPAQTATCTLVTGNVGLLEDQFQGRAFDARENFFHLNLDASYTRVLPADFGASLHIVGQLADSSLVTNEQFGIGGVGSIRGYFLSEAVGDDGLAGSLELRSPSGASLFGNLVDEARLFAFGDAGHVRVRSPALEQDATIDLVGVGGGGRIVFLRYFTGELLVGVPLITGPVTDRGDPRIRFSIKGEF